MKTKWTLLIAGFLFIVTIQACSDKAKDQKTSVTQESRGEKSAGIEKDISQRIIQYAKSQYTLAGTNSNPVIDTVPIDFYALKKYYEQFDSQGTGGIQLFPGLQNDTIVFIIGVSVNNSLIESSFRLLHPVGDKKAVLKNPIDRKRTIGLINQYFDSVLFDSMPLNKKDTIDKISRYYPWQNLMKYFLENEGTNHNIQDYHLKLYHGWIENDSSLLTDLYSRGNTQYEVPSKESLVGFTGLWELFKRDTSVTTLGTSQNTRRGLIEEIAKPCPPRCEDVNGITKLEL